MKHPARLLCAGLVAAPSVQASVPVVSVAIYANGDLEKLSADRSGVKV
jgi:hypothetical protein